MKFMGYTIQDNEFSNLGLETPPLVMMRMRRMRTTMKKHLKRKKNLRRPLMRLLLLLKSLT